MKGGEAPLALIKIIATQLRILLSIRISTHYKLILHILAAVSYVLATSFLTFYEGMQCKVVKIAVHNYWNVFG